MLNIEAISRGPYALEIGSEKPNPGRDGTITSKESFISPPNLSGWAKGSITSKNSRKDPGQP